MLKFNPVALFVVLAAAAVTTPLSAQSRSTVSSATLEATVMARPTANRAAVTAVLTSSQAVATAQRLGVGAAELSDRVAALDDTAVQEMSDRILTGGSSTILISTTTVIIFLLLLILLTN